MSLESLVARMTELASLDARKAVTGASDHDWQGQGVSPEALDALEAAAGVTLPSTYRRWVSELVGVGAGPFRGTVLPPAGASAASLGAPFNPAATSGDGPIPGALHFARLPDGGEAFVAISGPHAGSVWGDSRGAGAGLTPLAVDLEAFIEAWLTIASAEWGIAYGAGEVPAEATPAFGDTVRAATETLLGAEAAASPLMRRYAPTAADLKHLRARFLLGDGDIHAAELAFADAAIDAEPGSALVVLGRCAIAEARGDLAAWAAAADAGLRIDGLSHADRKRLLAQRTHALEAADRYPEALDSHIELCEHDPSDLREWLTVAYLMCHFGEFDRAVNWLRRVLDLNTGLDDELSLREKMEQASTSVLAALREEGYESDATSLEEAIERYLLTAELWG